MDGNQVSSAIKAFVWFLIIGIIAAVTLCFVALSHAKTTAPVRNSLGVTLFDDNKNAYLLGTIVDGTVYACGERTCTVVTFRPYNTSTLHTETINFCNSVVEQLIPVSRGPLVIAYDRVSHRYNKGIACHDLTGAFSVKGGK